MTGSDVVVDATVVLEYLVQSRSSAEASRLFARVVEDELRLWAPDLIYAESLSGLRKLVGRGALSAAAARRGAGWLPGLPLIVTGTRPLAGSMWLLGDVLDPYRSAYAALAARLEAPVVTADPAFAEALRARGRSVRLIPAE